MEKIRIQKFFTDNGIMSRRAAEREILAGKVKVNGDTALIGQKIDPARDRVEYSGRLIEPAVFREYTYIMLNKPRGYLSSASDDRGRRCVTELVSDCGSRVYPVGRLDMDSDGLLLMTDDGALAYRLTHPRHEIPKLYRVTLRGELTDSEIDCLRQPTELDGYRLAPVTVKLLTRGGGITVISMTLREGRNRQIRRMCEMCGLIVLRLTRIAVGSITLGNLREGCWRRLTDDEIKYLGAARPDGTNAGHKPPDNE